MLLFSGNGTGNGGSVCVEFARWLNHNRDFDIDRADYRGGSQLRSLKPFHFIGV
jgi:hypothetical protein